jgi:Ribbon-helix-helix protein, copG family
MMYAVYMKRTTVFLTDDLEHLLQEAARRAHRPQAEIVRDALTQYLRAHPRPWPRSLPMGENSDPSVTSENVKDWVREQWRQDVEGADEAEPGPPVC